MAHQTASRVPHEATIPTGTIPTGTIPTLADAIAAVRAADLPLRRTQELIAALNTTARVLGGAPAQIPAGPVLLRRRLAEAAPLAHGVSVRRWANVRSLVGSALGLIVPLSPSRQSVALTADWQCLCAGLAQGLADKRRYADLRRFIGFCSSHGIAPAQVDAAVFARYQAWLASGLRKDPQDAYAAVCRTWNKAVRLVPGWPGFQMVRASRRQTWTLPWSAFPASLEADVRRWLDRLAGQDLAEELPFPPVRPATLQAREYQLRAAASALVRRGRAPGTIQSLQDLAALDSFKEILRYLHSRREATGQGGAASQMVHTATLLKAIARHRLALPQATLDAMAGVIRRLDASRPGLTKRNRDRLRVFDDPAQGVALNRLPARLMDAASTAHPPRKGALLAQTALAIDLLLLAPVRIGNLVAIDIARHLVRIGKRHVSLVIEAHEVKNAEPLDYPLHPQTVALLDSYLRDHRPHLARPGTTALFPGRTGGPKTINTLRQQIMQTIRQHTGLVVNPHLFRHIGAKVYLDAHPGAYEVVRRVLGHRSMKTTTNFYTGLETAAAVRHFDAVILQQRKPGSQA